MGKSVAEVLRKPKSTDKDTDKDAKKPSGKNNKKAMLDFISKHKNSKSD